MVKALFDTNILIDYLSGVHQARQELGLYSTKAISIVTWMEVLVGVEQSLEAGTRGFLNTFDVIPLDGDVAVRAVQLRREHRMRLPDAVIWASADSRSMLLVTRNTKDFGRNLPGIRVPYEL